MIGVNRLAARRMLQISAIFGLLVLALGMAQAQIVADSPPYRIEWNGKEGKLIRRALGPDPAQEAALTYLHTDPGPKGYARHLAWFLAREPDGFALVWCYLNDTGREFMCWLYTFPANRLTSLRFVGDYRFVPPEEPRAPTALADFRLQTIPRYLGPDFAFRNWTRRSGSLARLDLFPAKSDQAASAPGDRSAAPAKSLTNLRATPLHELSVGAQNGWRDQGWRELHALAFDAASDPYYLILYTNTTRGFVVDLKRAVNYVTDFGEKVRFSEETSAFGSRDNQNEEPTELTVPRYVPHEISLLSAQPHDNPFTEVLLEAKVTSPDGRSISVPGFWDGGDTWRLRLTPTMVGTWTWRTLSNDPDLNNKTGTFECVGGEGVGKGFLQIYPSPSYRRHFAYSDGAPFYPVAIRESVHRFASAASPPPTGSTRPAALTQEGRKEALPASFQAFQQRIDALAAKGVNRLTGGYLLEKGLFAANKQANEGGAPFFETDLDRPNPAYFQWMDRRVIACNVKGIVPDIGLGWPDQGIFTTYSEPQLRRLWRYVLARYSCFDVCWNLFGRDETPLPEGAGYRIADFAGLTRLYDPYHHLITTVTMEPKAKSRAAAPGNDAPGKGKVRIFRPDDSDPPGESQPPGKQPPKGSGQTIKPGEGEKGRPENPPRDTSVPTNENQANSALRDVLEQAQSQETSDDQTPSRTNNKSRKKPKKPDVEPVVETPFVKEPWMGVVTLAGEDLGALTRNWSASKPLFLLGTPGADIEALRRRLWETRMRGGYWIATPSGDNPLALDSPELALLTGTARFFQKTRFWRLEPHPEMVGRPEDPRERRRRKRAEQQAALEKAAEAGGAPEEKAPTAEPAKTAGPIYVLADPSWEYVVYFTQGGNLTLDLIEATGRIKAVWYNPRTGQSLEEMTMTGGAYASFIAPDSNDWVLYLSRR